MKRVASTLVPLRHRHLITPRIVQGQWTGKRFSGDSIFAANCRYLAKAFVRARHRAQRNDLADLFGVVEERSCILEQLRHDRHKILVLIQFLFEHRDRWQRPVLDWEPASSSAREQATELVRHLFERYPVPRFLRATWLARPRRFFDWTAFGWYLHVTSGGNIRTAPNMPVKLSRRAAHEMMHAPTSCARQAIRYGQLRAQRMHETRIWEVLRSAASTSFELDDCLMPLFEKMASDDTLPFHQIGPLIDYVLHMRSRADDPSSYTVAHRPLHGLLRHMQRWHQQLAQGRAVLRHLGAGASAALWTTTWAPLRNATPRTDLLADGSWTMEEISSFQSLFVEGQRMRHCVATYARSCIGGQTSIWSLHKRAKSGIELERVTVRVEVSRRRVVEARGFANGPISTESLEVLTRWANEHRMSLVRIPVQQA